MPICTGCGVAIEERYRNCPLCGRSLDKVRTDASEDRLENVTEPACEKDVPANIVVLEVFSFVAVSSALVVLATDLAWGMDVSWSRLPLLSIGYVWLAVFQVTLLRRKPWLLATVEFLSACLFLFTLDTLTSGPPWFWGIALPVLFVLALLILATAAFIRLRKPSVLGMLSAGLASGAVFTLLIDMLLNWFFSHSLRISWSMVTAVSVIPIIVFLSGFEKRLKKRGSSLKKYFFT